jgi:hypothetical protein
MRFTWAVAAAALAIGGSAMAGELTSVAPEGASVGIGVICNTAEQAEHFVKLRAGGADPRIAMHAVNDAAKDPRACGLAAVAFVRDAMINSQAVQNKLMQVVRINVLAGYNGTGWQQTAGMIQYAIIEGEGEAI